MAGGLGGSLAVRLQTSKGLFDLRCSGGVSQGWFSAGGCGGDGASVVGGCRGAAEGVGSVGLGLGVGRTETGGEGERGCFWHSVQPSRKRVTASRGRKAYVSVIWN